MKVLFRWLIAAALGLAVMAGARAEAQQTGALSGVVRDAQGGVLPGRDGERHRRRSGARRAPP